MPRTKAKNAALKLIGAQEQAEAPSAKKSAPRATTPRIAAPAPVAEREPPIEALVDGKRVVIDAADEIVLRCGKASITLRRNGRVVIRGTYVETRAEGVNRVKGGSVQIN